MMDNPFEDDAEYEKTTAVLAMLRAAAVTCMHDGDSTNLGVIVGHLQTDHPQYLPRVLILAMIDMALLREMMREVAAKLVTARGGTPTSDDIDEVLAELKNEVPL